jgi:para-aminobenzoate synthetase component 1
MVKQSNNSNTLPVRRNKVSYKISTDEVVELKERILNWLKQFSILSFLDNNYYSSTHGSYECIAAAGKIEVADGSDIRTLEYLQQAYDTHGDWLFGHICYEYKDLLEPKLASTHKSVHNFPLLHFVVPETVCHINREQDTFTIETVLDANDVYKAIVNTSILAAAEPLPKLTFAHAISKEEYLHTIHKLRRHIADGDCYEINYCISGNTVHQELDTLSVFRALNLISPSPFAAYYRLNENFMMCASPERYIRKDGAKIISQPIKGTARRDATPGKDEQIKNALYTDIKERAENVMIVDLVRNDLARCCQTGSVQVDELFGIYSFPQVHQMISTVSGQLKTDNSLTDAIRTTFPMGSMTGAPKHKVMQLIEHYETARRELFSGTIGYITPAGNFDFNVVIRSLFYNSRTGALSWSAGGAITYDSIPESEWEEIRLKAWALERIFM